MDTEQPTDKKPLHTVRTPKNRAYFAAARATAQDTALSYEARGVLFYLLSKPDDWIIRAADIVNNSGKKANGKPQISKRKAEALLTELRNAGYLKTEFVRERGRFVSKMERLYDVAQLTATSKNRRAVKPQSGKTAERKNDHIHNTDSLHNTDTTCAPAKADAQRSSTDDSVKANKPKKERARNPLFDATAQHLFGIPEGATVTQGARIGKVVTVCKAHGVVADDVPAFVAWYKREYPNVSVPRDAGKLEEHLIKWQAQRKAKASQNGGQYLREYGGGDV